MKRGIHLDLFETTITYSNGDTGKVFLTKEMPSIRLEVDKFNHPAWNKSKKSNYEIFSQVNKFKEKFNLEI